MNRLEKANNYIKENKHKVTNRPLFHFSPEIGWMNDPNGFSHYKGKYHLFYQYNPYDVVWNDMHWGHAITEDFVHWNYLPVALTNDKSYDANGCFSGSAIEKDGDLYLIYTGHIDPNIGFDRDEPEIAERQCVAVSHDGVTFEKSPLNPVIGEKQLPEGYLICDFRDPKVLEVNGVYYCVLSVRNKQRRGEIIMFKSIDLLEWAFYSSIYQTKYEENTLLECPDLFRIDGKDVLLFSEMPCDPEFSNEIQNVTSYVIGEMDFEKGRFIPEKKGRLDDGETFYAPQSTEGKNGERLLIGWMHRWSQTSPPKEYGFNGIMSIPRELKIKNGDLVQQAAIDVDHLFQPTVLHENIQLDGRKIEIDGDGTGYFQLTVDPAKSKSFIIELNKNETKSTRVAVDTEHNMLVLESDYGHQEPVVVNEVYRLSDEAFTLECFVDLHSVELFVNGGEKVISFTAYDMEKGQSATIGGNVYLKSIRYGTFQK